MRIGPAGSCGWQIDGDADIPLWLLPRPHGGLDDNGVAGVNDVAGVDAGGFEFYLCTAGNGIDIEVDGPDGTLARAVCVEQGEALISLYGGGKLRGALVAGRRPRGRAATADSLRC